MELKTLFDKIDQNLARSAEVSRFYSDEDFIVVSSPRETRISDVNEVLRPFGYAYYDAGASDNRVMITFKRKA